jgi:sulfotransferase
MTTVRNRVGHWLGNPPVGPALLRLIDAVERGVDKHVHVIKFEELTARPEPTIKRVYEYLEEPYFAHDFEHVEQATVEDDAQHGFYGDHTIRPNVRPVPLDYREVLGEQACVQIKQSYGLFYAKFYPDLK